MKLSELKFSMYDFMAYFLSGAVFTLAFFIARAHYAGEPVDPNAILVWLKAINATTVLLVILLLYVLGHVIATLSSFFIENLLVTRFLDKLHADPAHAVSKNTAASFREKFKTVFGFEFENEDFRLVESYTQEYTPAGYSTAFVFLCVYGMARNLSFNFLLFTLCELLISIVSRNAVPLSFAGIYLFIGIVLFVHFIRFNKHFLNQIISSFLCAGNNT